MMEPWSYNLEGKGLMFSDEIDLQVDVLATSKKPSEWGDKSTFNFERNGLVSNGEAVARMELEFHDFVRKPFHGNQGMEILSGEVCCTSKREVSPQCIFASNSCFEEVASEAKLSSSVLEANSLNSSLIDLKLGRLADWKDVENSKILKIKPVLPSAPPSLLTKRARKASSYSQTAFCQVYGCNKDLSSSKDYHKRHKVCDVHSKTTKVIVNGIEQRFCQQCSRFHLLAEFDDGKRSCRKRLAGHNERRRKPQLDTLSGKHKLLQSYQGTGYLGTSLPKRTPLFSQTFFKQALFIQENLYKLTGLDISNWKGSHLTVLNQQCLSPVGSCFRTLFSIYMALGNNIVWDCLHQELKTIMLLFPLYRNCQGPQSPVLLSLFCQLNQKTCQVI
ncbi:hypothetical protein I3842_06G093900 [Carya illinoinensis]|uniref:SBP-type domain-containing protein n=1 Tax=Carya illinoinensis TaxID=32201 RepID=A0A922JLE3_CARIL|nr:hypothetical protein I3842_06G093900 [Carya illinoinensis]KAG6708682.1 hypothetical protein I3842_06G093900 [Carya illinoinensis]KAG6708683.1 hypothetical protein I3842_06G093900 [Carya illinoinensis]KAG6708684.1 hypothetical protein I3842_06G093900 [Carya illinoinensis]